MLSTTQVRMASLPITTVALLTGSKKTGRGSPAGTAAPIIKYGNTRINISRCCQTKAVAAVVFLIDCQLLSFCSPSCRSMRSRWPLSLLIRPDAHPYGHEGIAASFIWRHHHLGSFRYHLHYVYLFSNIYILSLGRPRTPTSHCVLFIDEIYENMISFMLGSSGVVVSLHSIHTNDLIFRLLFAFFLPQSPYLIEILWSCIIYLYKRYGNTTTFS